MGAQNTILYQKKISIRSIPYHFLSTQPEPKHKVPVVLSENKYCLHFCANFYFLDSIYHKQTKSLFSHVFCRTM